MHAAPGKKEDEVGNSTVAQWITVLEEKLGKVAAYLQAKNN